VNVTVPDLSNAVTWKCIEVRTGGSVTLDPNNLPAIPGLEQAQKLFNTTEDFLVGKANGIIQFVARLGAVAKPLQAIDKGLTDIEALRSTLESAQNSQLLSLAELFGIVTYVLFVLLGLIQGLRMLFGPNAQKP
jgi:hypothetical protein